MTLISNYSGYSTNKLSETFGVNQNESDHFGLALSSSDKSNRGAPQRGIASATWITRSLNGGSGQQRPSVLFHTSMVSKH